MDDQISTWPWAQGATTMAFEMGRVKPFKQFPIHMKAHSEAFRRLIENEAPEALGVLGTEFAAENFEKKGFQGATFQPWEPRKTINRRGRDLTRYKRGRHAGKLTRFGRGNEGRALLVKSSDMRASMEGASQSWLRTGPSSVAFFSTSYAPTHNFGDPSRNIPQRRFLGTSPILHQRIRSYLRRRWRKIIKK